jgi:hypothetical protein
MATATNRTSSPATDFRTTERFVEPWLAQDSYSSHSAPGERAWAARPDQVERRVGKGARSSSSARWVPASGPTRTATRLTTAVGVLTEEMKRVVLERKLGLCDRPSRRRPNVSSKDTRSAAYAPHDGDQSRNRALPASGDRAHTPHRLSARWRFLRTCKRDVVHRSGHRPPWSPARAGHRRDPRAPLHGRSAVLAGRGHRVPTVGVAHELEAGSCLEAAEKSRIEKSKFAARTCHIR